jgi:hypothetical protein
VKADLCRIVSAAGLLLMLIAIAIAVEDVLFLLFDAVIGS